jgi:hypothetical protein
VIVKVTVAGMTFLAALGATGLIQEGGRPVCNAHNRGALWPDRSAWGPCTEVELCTVRMRKYQWKSATIHVSQLSKDPRHTNSCESVAVKNEEKGSTPSAAAAAVIEP